MANGASVNNGLNIENKLDVCVIENPDSFTAVFLKSWLSEKKLKSSGTKLDLVKRIKLLRPVGSKNKPLLLQQEQEKQKDTSFGTSVGEKQNHNDTVQLPADNAQWIPITSSPNSIPGFTMSNIIDYFVLKKACDKNNCNDFKNLLGKSYPLFKCGHVQNIRLCQDNDKVFLCCKCLPEMRKNVEYKIKVCLQKPDGKILYASCGCVAGKGPSGSCKHIGSFCYAIEEFVQLGFSRNYVTCTSKLQEWNKPRARRLKPQCLYDINFARQKHPNNNDVPKKRKRESKSVKDFNPRPLKYRNTNLTVRLKQSVFKHKINCGFSKIFPVDNSSVTSKLSDQNEPSFQLLSSVRVGILADIQNKDKELTNSKSSVFEKTPEKENACNGLESVHHKPIDPEQVFQYMISLKLSEEQRRELELKTKNQASSVEWINIRKQTVTASYFGTICGSNVYRQSGKEEKSSVLKSITGQYPRRNLFNFSYGKENEPKAVVEYLDNMKLNGHPQINAEMSGIFIHPDYGWLGASPDRLICDPSNSSDPYGLLEVKCPISLTSYASVAEVHNNKRFYCEYDATTGQLKLKQSSPYYKQVQGQMAITGRNWCDFVVWTPNWISIQRIKFNYEYWKAMFVKLEHFYLNWLGPHILRNTK